MITEDVKVIELMCIGDGILIKLLEDGTIWSFCVFDKRSDRYWKLLPEKDE